MLGRDTQASLSKYHLVNYTLRAFARSCQYRNTTSNKWMSNEGIDEVLYYVEKIPAEPKSIFNFEIVVSSLNAQKM